MRIEGKVWVVTGAGAGMGRELTLEILRRGGRVAAVDLRAETLAETAALAGAGARLSTHTVDITDRDAVQALPAAVRDAHGTVDGLINNAGIIQPFVPVVELPYADVRRVMEVNFFGPYNLVEAFLPLLLDRPEAHLANVSSMGGFFPFPGQTIYGASKAAVKLLTEGLYAELRDTAVQVTAIFPGAVRTGITENSGVDASAMGDTEDSKVPMLAPAKAAALMLSGIERNRLHVYVGTDSKLMSSAIRIAPKPAIGLMQRLMAKATGQS